MPLHPGSSPAPTYDFSIEGIAATVSANNLLALHNPVGSGKILGPGAFFISNLQTAVSTVTTGIRGFRFTGAPTGGTLQAASAVAKFKSTDPAPAGEIYTGNPTISLGAAILNSPPGLDKRASGTHQIDIPPGAGPFVLLPGEGLVLRQSAGIVGLYWNISVVWREV